MAWNTQQQGMEVGAEIQEPDCQCWNPYSASFKAATNYSISADLYAHLENGAANCYGGY